MNAVNTGGSLEGDSRGADDGATDKVPVPDKAELGQTSLSLNSEVERLRCARERAEILLTALAHFAYDEVLNHPIPQEVAAVPHFREFASKILSGQLVKGSGHYELISKKREVAEAIFGRGSPELSQIVNNSVQGILHKIERPEKGADPATLQLIKLKNIALAFDTNFHRALGSAELGQLSASLNIVQERSTEEFGDCMVLLSDVQFVITAAELEDLIVGGIAHALKKGELLKATLINSRFPNEQRKWHQNKTLAAAAEEGYVYALESGRVHMATALVRDFNLAKLSSDSRFAQKLAHTVRGLLDDYITGREHSSLGTLTLPQVVATAKALGASPQLFELLRQEALSADNVDSDLNLGQGLARRWALGSTDYAQSTSLGRRVAGGLAALGSRHKKQLA